jgi:predicted adenine nucleotide alpha hydrolase (AANH) superfamily ATPase
MVAEIAKLDYRPKLLLHSCCGPCSTYVIELLSKAFDLTIYFYNPNIFPEREYDLRAKVQRDFISNFDKRIKFIEEYYDNKEYDTAINGYESFPEKSERCFHCYRFRIEKTFEKAIELGYDYVCTTISVSKHKNVEYVIRAGKELEQKTGIKFLVSDFKKNNGYQRTIEMSRDYDLYRQDYCGCKYSKKEREECQ